MEKLARSNALSSESSSVRACGRSRRLPPQHSLSEAVLILSKSSGATYSGRRAPGRWTVGHYSEYPSSQPSKCHSMTFCAADLPAFGPSTRLQ